MSHHLRTTSRTRRTRRTAAVTTVAAAVVLSAGLVTALPATAHAAEAHEVLVPAPDAYGEGTMTVLASGSQGVLHREGGDYLWTTTYNRTTKPVPALDGVPQDAIVRGHDEFNRVIYTRPRADGGTDYVRVGIEDPAFNSTVSVPAGYLNQRVANGWVLATVDQGDGTYQLRVARGGDPASDPVVQLPAGATTGPEPVLLSAYSNQLVIGYRTADGTPGYGILTAYNGRVVPLPVTGDASSFRITQTTVSWFSRSGEPGVRVMPRGSTAAPRVVPLATQSPDSEVTTFVVGDNVLWYEGGGGRLNLTPFAGADTGRTLLSDVEQTFLRSEGTGSLVAYGKDADGKRAVHLFHVNGLDLVSDLRLREVPRVKTADGAIDALSLDRGRLRYLNSLGGERTLHGKDIGTGLDPVDGTELAGFPGLEAGRFADGTDEGLARLVADPDTGADVLVTGDDPEHPADSFPLPGTNGRILDAAPEFVLYEAGGRQYVVDTARDLLVREQPAQAAVLEQKRLFKPALNNPGTVKVINLRSGEQVRTINLGSACVPDELQHSGTLLYWSCAAEDAAGVRDLATGHSYPAPASGVLLGDRFLAHRDTAGALRLTALQADGGTADLGTATGLKQPAEGDGRGTTWTLDAGAGKLAWVGTDDTVHVTAPQRAVSPLRVARTDAPRNPAGEWGAAWWLSKPAASWRVTLTHRATGEVVRTWTGEGALSAVRVTWDGTSESGTPAAAGGYTWKLTATPADGAGADATASGVVRITG
ncbi:FlgD immunoglobulin-like domain containing protein [Streptomyces sp. AC627_RSS907]|uniref:FlgD immunoglobulin-like domain containing protein n=1 Tax=Streptomyces sp. AC627_RSS907 TaxID=2823684 RepID=UPI0027E467BE|nr:FlgD immunoglobulin-like domain containing protein [Streptomyces sp. AC627_RSS907]